MIISDNGISKVELIDGWVYKTQPKFMTDNEAWCLKSLLITQYVPNFEQVGIETLKLEYIETTPITDLAMVEMHFKQVLINLEFVGIRHGDLTEKNILVRNNHPFIIDFSESRLNCDPRPDKRREGDDYWLNKTLEGYAAQYALP